MTKGIFILGGQRSGTTYLSNLLISHPSIVGVAHKKHCGIYESSFFSHIEGRYGNLKYYINYLEFISVMSRTDYFKLMGYDFNSLMKFRVDNYKDFFKDAMNEFAKKNSSDYWLEKTPAHSFYCKKLLDYFPDYKFIWIERKFMPTLKSAINLHFKFKPSWHSKLFFSIRTLITYHIYNKIKSIYASKLYIVSYDDIVNSKKNVLIKLFDYLELDNNYEIDSKFKINTSYDSDDLIEFGILYRFFLNTLRFMIKIIPFSLLFYLKNSRLRKARENLPLWSFSLLNTKF